MKQIPVPVAPPKATDKDLNKWKAAGFPEKIFHQYPDFVDFIFKNNLHHMITYYQKNDKKENHNIIFPQNPQLLFRGVYTDWQIIRETVKKELQVDSQGRIIKGLTEDGALKGWFYTYDRGLDTWDISTWGQNPDIPPRPIRQLPPEQCPKEYRFTLCCAYKNYAQRAFKKVHCYIEITTTQGKVYNFGLWSPEIIEKAGIKGGFLTAYGEFNCPDGFEFMGERVSITKTDFDIDEKQFKQLWQWLHDKKQEGVPFNWTEKNCTTFAVDAAKVAGIDINTRQTVVNLMPKKIQTAAKTAWNYTPSFTRPALRTVEKILCIVPNIFVNTLRCLLFGAAKGIEKTITDKDGKKSKIKIRVINSVKDFFLKGFEFHPPGILLDYLKEHNNKKMKKLS